MSSILTVDNMLIFGMVGSVAAYFFDFPKGFKAWVNDIIDSITGGGSKCQAFGQKNSCDILKGNLSTSDRVLFGKGGILAMILLYAKTQPTQTQGTNLVNRITQSDALAVTNSMQSYCNNGCTNRQPLWTLVRNLAMKYASQVGIALKPIPTTPPAVSATGYILNSALQV